MKNISITFILLLSTLFCFGQSFNTAKLDSLFDLLKEHDKFMGSVELSQNNKVLYARTIGYADLENKHVADQNTKYRIGSISKTFTTALVFIAIESDKLSLDQTIASYFPNVVNADKINIKHLLGHSSGIYNFTNDEDYLDWNTEKQSKEDMIKRISNLESDFEPGSKHDYSNSNFILLTYILEDIYGESYSTLISNMIAKPLGLKNTKFGSTIDIDNNDCHSYYFDGQWVKESETDMSVPLGAGALISTPHDLNLFIEAMFAGDLISKESLAMMMNIEDGYGLGMFKYPYNDKWSYGHGEATSQKSNYP